MTIKIIITNNVLQLSVRGNHHGPWPAGLPLPPGKAVAGGAGEVPKAGHLSPHAGHGQVFR